MTADGCGRSAAACHHAARRWPDNLDVDERPVSADVMGQVARHHQGIDSDCIDACVGNFVPNAVIVDGALPRALAGAEVAGPSGQPSSELEWRGEVTPKNEVALR